MGNGGSLHKQDWLKLGLGAGAIAAPFAAPAIMGALGGAGAAGSGGLLSGLFGGGAGAAGAGAGAAGGALAGGLGAGAADEVMGGTLMGAGTPGILGNASLGLSNFKTMNPGIAKFAGGMGKAMLGGAMQPQQAPQPQMPPGLGTGQNPPSSAQTLSGVFGDPSQSMANLTPEQRQMLMQMMGH